MESKKLTAVIETLEKYKSDFKREFAFDLSIEEAVRSDVSSLDSLIEAVISLICRIGVNSDMTPNIHGVTLDNVLETLNQIRQEYFN